MYLPYIRRQSLYDVSDTSLKILIQFINVSYNSSFSGCENCDEWYHGDCVNVTERDAKTIKRYYCKKCRKRDPKLSVVYKSKYKDERKSSHHHHHKSSHKEKRRDKDSDRHRDKDKKKSSEAPPIKKLKSESANAKRHSSVDSKGKNSPERDVFHDISAKSINEEEEEKSPLRRLSNTDEDTWEPPVSKHKEKGSSKKVSKGSSTTTKSAEFVSMSKRKRSRRSSGSDSDGHDPKSVLNALTLLKGSRQCYGPKCKKEARQESKYCSDQCGMNLASVRIMQTLPDRIREWNMAPCEAEKRNRRELEAIRAKQETVKATLEQLNRDFRTLEELIVEGKSQSIEERDSDDEDDSSAVEMTVHCVTCGSDVQTRTAIRHMERCYNKIESQTSFASRFKTQIEDERMFCDFYNPKEGTYCKRLQVLCPDHNPDEKRVIRDDEVCGAPLQNQLFSKPVEFCRSSKKACQAHYCWEKLRRAELDMERVKQWMKVDELLEQERQVRASMSNRAGVLGLLLHSSFNHEMEDRLRGKLAAGVRK